MKQRLKDQIEKVRNGESTSLDLSGNQITDISFLQNLTGLTSLDLSGNQIRDISFLQNLTELTSLNLSYSGIRDISFLQNLTELTSLDLSGNQITDYSFLQNLTGLIYLYLSGNQITDFSFLKDLTGLTYLYLSGNQITDFSFLQDLTGLTELDLSGNQITDISFLQDLTGLTELDLSGNQITDISFLQNLTGLTELDLSENQITDISFLKDLTGLTFLLLSGNKITDFSFLQNLTGLTFLNLSGNKITDISFLQDLTGLTELYLSGNKITDFSFLQNLTGLTYLDLSGNQITDIFFLQNLTGLTYLDLSGNKITDISFLQDLTGLTYLYLSGNKITDFSFLQNLTGLTFLLLSGNKITDISFLQNLTGLTELDLSGNQITDISFLQNLSGLTSLGLRSNQITDISFLKDFTGLTYLGLRSNQITDTSFLKDLTGLIYLDLSENQITYFPIILLKLKRLGSLSLSENPIGDFPQEIYNQYNCLKDARGWVADLEKGGVINNELKMILIGNGRVGKTCIVKRLIGEKFNEAEKSTHAIQVKNWTTPLMVKSEKRESTIRIWDFGGQDIYHATHRYFMQSRALVLLVWDIVTETQKVTPSDVEESVDFNNYQLPHWVDYIGSLSKRSPVIIVQNKRDRDGRRSVENRGYLEGLYPHIVDYESVSAATGKGFEDLKELMQEAFEQMPELGMEMPTSWYQVRQAIFERVEGLENKKKEQQRIEEAERFLSSHQFEELCQMAGVSFNSQGSLLGYLHNTGCVFYQEELFDNRIILDQAWAIQAVYSLFDRERKPSYFDLLKNNNGRFDKSLLAVIWQKNSKKEQEVFLSLMRSCELCFQVNKDEEYPVYIAPQLLPKTRPSSVAYPYEETTQPILHFVYYHPFLHQAILHRFMVRAGHLAKEQKIWFNGIQFRYEKTWATIEVVEKWDSDFGEEKKELKEVVMIRVTGARSQDLLSLIRKEFGQIQPDAMQPREMVSLDQQNWVAYKDLVNAQKAGVAQLASIQGQPLEMEKLKDFMLLQKPFQEVAVKRSHKEAERVARDAAAEERKEVSLQDLSPERTFLDLVKEGYEVTIKPTQLGNQAVGQISQMMDEKLRQTIANISDVVKQELGESEARILLPLLKELEVMKLNQENAEEWLGLVVKGINSLMKKVDDELATELFRIQRQLEKTEVELKDKLKISIPLIPMILNYESELTGDWIRDLKERWSRGGWKGLFIENE